MIEACDGRDNIYGRNTNQTDLITLLAAIIGLINVFISKGYLEIKGTATLGVFIY